MPPLPLSCARAIALQTQALAAVACADGQSLSHLVERIGAVQVDTISVLARNHDLALLSRQSNYFPDALADALYEKRTLIEQHYPLLIVPVHEYSYWQSIMSSRPPDTEPEDDVVRALVAAARELLRDNGTVSIKHLPATVRVAGGFSTISAANKALEWLWYHGEVIIARRESNRAKVYALPESLLPASIVGYHPSCEEVLIFCAKKALSVLGIATVDSWSRLANVYAGLWKTIPTAQRRSVLSQLVESGWATRIDVGDRVGEAEQYFIPSTLDLGLLSVDDADNRTRLLPPLDLLLVDRNRVEKLFGFSHKFEAYTPQEKRRYGYYSMPILFHQRLVGRLDPARAGEALRLRRVLIEDSALLERSEFLESFLGAINSLREFVGGSEVVIEGEAPDGIATALESTARR